MDEYLNKQSLTVSFVKLSSLSSLNKFIKTIPRGICVVNYLDIYNKLTRKYKNTIYEEPSDCLISAELSKLVLKILSDKKQQNIYYILDIMESNIEEKVSNISEYISGLNKKINSYETIEFCLISDDNDIIKKQKI